MKIEIEVTHHELDHRGLVVVIPRAALLAWFTAAFEKDPLPIPEVTPPPAMTLADLHLSTRTIRCLSEANVRTVEQLTRLWESDLVKLKGLGKVCLSEIKAALKKNGLRLGTR
jgi:DNA-directed RNA polymerase alpha subunit